MMTVFMTLKFSRERLEAFYRQNLAQIETYTDTRNEHEKLLREYMVDMHARIDKMLDGSAVNFKIKLSNAEAMAFYQVWQKVDLRHCLYSKVIVEDAIAKIDQFHKSAAAKNRRLR